MFGSIGMPELIIIMVIALIIFGPRKLPELGKSLGRSINEFKRASTDLQNTLEQEIKLEEQKETAGQDARAATPTSTACPTPAGRRPRAATVIAQRREPAVATPPLRWLSFRFPAPTAPNPRDEATSLRANTPDRSPRRSPFAGGGQTTTTNRPKGG